MSFLKLDGVDLYYELHGEGPGVVFIHGASGMHLSWWQQIAEMRHHFSCLVYDQRGYGRSRPTAPYDVGDGSILYDDLRRLIEHAELGARVSIVGASLGTVPAMYYAMEHQDRMDKLMLVCGAGTAVTPAILAGRERRARGMKARYAEMAQRQQQAPGLQPAALATQAASKHARVPPVRSKGEFERFAVAYHPFGPVGEAMHLDSPALTFLYAEIMAMSDGPRTIDLDGCFESRPVTPEEAAVVKFPVMVVGGTEDALFAPEELTELAQMFPRAELNLVKGAGHAVYYERARRFNDLALAFLRG